jgi:hypothetical protein
MEKLLEEYRCGYQLLRKSFVLSLKLTNGAFIRFSSMWQIPNWYPPRKVLSEEAPLLMSFDQDTWANTLEYEKLDSDQHLLLFKLLRSGMLPILEQLPAQKWGREGIYADAGPFTLKQLLEYRVEHIQGHLAQIARVREAYWLR